MNLRASLGIGPTTTTHYKHPVAPVDTATRAEWKAVREPDVLSSRGTSQRLPSGPGSRRTRAECIEIAKKARALMKANPMLKQGEVAKQLKLSASNLCQILARNKT